MARGREQIIILELFIITLIGGVVYTLFNQGVNWAYVQFTAFLIFIGALAPLILEARMGKVCIINARSMVLLGVLAWILLDPLTLRKTLEEFSPLVILKVFIMIVSFLIMLNLGYIIRWPNFFIYFFRKLDCGYSFDHRKLYHAILLCFLIGILPVIIWGGGLNNIIWILTHGIRFMAPWERGASGSWADYLKTGTLFFQMLSLQLIWFYFLFVSRRNMVLLLLACMGLWLTFNTGTRSSLGIVVIPFLLLYYLDRYNKKKKTRYLVFVFMYLLLSVMQLQFVIRHAPRGKPVMETINESFAGILTTRPIEYQRDDQFYRMLKIAKYVPEKIPYSGELLIFRPLYHFIPRAIWKDKPKGVTWHFERLTQERGVGLTTFAISIIGEFYICNGWLGVCVAGILMGFLAQQLDSLIEMSRRSPMVLAIYTYGLAFLFVCVRSYQVIFANWYIFIIFYFVLKAIKKKESIQWTM
ncbi:MAG: O-antigen polymerase [Candidatus Omnitrophota bacterium]